MNFFILLINCQFLFFVNSPIFYGMHEDEEFGFFRDENATPSRKSTEDSSIVVPVDSADKCIFCGEVLLNCEIKRLFQMNVCSGCSWEKLKFITKTRCIQEYLLTVDELKHFSYLSRPNPHKGTWNDMQLFLEDQIKEFAMEKYDSLEAIEKIKKDRERQRKTRKLENVKKRVKELKRKTFLNIRKEKHIHKFENRDNKTVCECGMEIEEEEIVD